MRNLNEDLKELEARMSKHNYSDEYLKENDIPTREECGTIGVECYYGITYVESNIAKEWLDRAIKAEAECETLRMRNHRNESSVSYENISKR